MATLSKHGVEVGRLEKLTCKIAYFSDGKILRNCGDGWKLWRKCKPGVDPAAAFQARKQGHDKFIEQRPCYAEFKRLLHSFCSFSHRYMVYTVLQSLANDPDGVWSELNDMLQISCGIEEVVELCQAYEASCLEAQQLKEANSELVSA